MTKELELARAAREMIRQYGNCGSPVQQAAADALAAAAARVEATQYATDEEIARARAEHETDDVKIDDDAMASRSNDGVWVSAWVWIDTPRSSKES